MGFGGPQPLTMTEIKSYCEYRGILHPDDKEEFLHLIQHMDRVWVRHSIDSSKTNPPKK